MISFLRALQSVDPFPVGVDEKFKDLNTQKLEQEWRLENLGTVVDELDMSVLVDDEEMTLGCYDC